MPTKVETTIPAMQQQQILNALVAAAFTLHSGKAVLDFARAIFETLRVEDMIQERKGDEKHVGMNGGWGEGQACKSLARAYGLLVENGEEVNAKELKEVALGRFTKETWEENLRSVQSGL